MYGYGYYGWGMDPTILLLVIGMLLSLAASAKLRSTFAVYKKVRSHSGITGAEAAQRILDRKSTRLNSSHLEQSRMPSSA